MNGELACSLGGVSCLVYVSEATVLPGMPQGGRELPSEPCVCIADDAAAFHGAAHLD